MWSNWHDRFKTFGAQRVEFYTSKWGGSKERRSITGAKCLLFFRRDDHLVMGGTESQFTLEDIAQKTLCSNVMEVSVEEEDFEHQIKDKQSSIFYGSRRGYPILKFTPSNIAESKGKESIGQKRYKAGLTIARVF